MKNADLMTPNELRALAKAKEKSINEEDKVVKTGILKHDLFCYPIDFGYNDGVSYYYPANWPATKKEIRDIILNFKNRCCVILPKGTKFLCFIVDGEESWYDEENRVVVDTTKEWAEEHLENISEILQSRQKKKGSKNG